MCHVAEEQGLMGAKLHAQKAQKAHIPIEAVLNNDIVGNDRGGNGIVDGASIRVYSKALRTRRRGSSRGSCSGGDALRAVAYGAADGAARSVLAWRRPLGVQPIRLCGGGLPRVARGFTRQHDPRDTFDGLSPAYLAQNARVNAAVAATLAFAPPAPVAVNDRGQANISRAPSGYDAHLGWTASPGATAYRIFWREAWGPDWQHELLVGNVTEMTLRIR